MLSNFYQISEVELQTVDGGGWVAVAVSAVATIVSITGGTASTVYTTYEAITGN